MLHGLECRQLPVIAAAAFAVAVTLGGCALRGVADAPAGRDAGSDTLRALPEGEGRAILERRCTDCHDLDGLWAYQGYYNEARWRSMIQTMVDHGAELDEAEIATLTSYLVEHFGPGTR